MKTKNWKQWLLDNAVIILILASAVVVGILKPNFLSLANIKNLISNAAVRFVIALGISGVLIMRNNDLSAGRQVGFASCIVATFLQRADYSAKVYPNIPELNMWLVLIVVMILFALVFGTINSIVVAKFHVPAFIGTYGMQTVIYGICLVFTGAQPIGGLVDSYKTLCSGSLFNIQLLSNLGVIAAIVAVIFWFLYNHTPYGKKMYAVGGNPAAAEVAGINIFKMTLASYMIASACFALAGFMLGGKAGGTAASMGDGYELFAIAGCTIGGVSVSGGTGKVSGILIGVLVFEVLKIELQFLGVDVAYTYIVQGIVIVFAIALDIRKYIAKK